MRRLAAAWIGVLALALALVPPTGAGAQSEVEVYRPRHRPPWELVEVARGLLRPGGDAVVDTHGGALVLTGSRASLRRALATLAELDREIASWRVHATMTTLRELEAHGVDVRGWQRVGDVRIGRAPHGRRALELRVNQLATDGARRFEGQVAVMDGRTAELWTGEVHPERQRFVHRHGGHLRVHETVTLVPIRTGFRVRPRQLPDGRVELEIEPVMEERTEGGHVIRAGASTRVVLTPGEAAVVASAAESHSDLAIDPFGALDHREGSSESAFVVLVTK